MSKGETIDLSLEKYRRESGMKSGSARDVLADILDRIDNRGQLDKIDCLVVCMRENVDGETFTFFAQHSPNLQTSIGTMEVAKAKMIGTAE